MATQAFYRKWRSQTFAELVGQEHVTRTLLNSVRSGRVAHAYVFSGPRGVGKTSAARLLAKAVNCLSNVDGEPCNECSSCRAIAESRALDVIEIDAASNRGIEEIRDLREKVNFAPSDSRYKFYILDEAHMLTGDAANAFLKTLEEPPAHTVFVMVTTEAHRLPATVLSRCQRLDFHRIPLPAMLGRLRQVCQAEGVEVEPAALELIARGATGSLRDAEGLLDQLVAYAGSHIGVEQVRSIIGLAGGEAAHELLRCLADGDLAGGLRLINRLVEAGADPRHFGRELVEYLRGLMLLKAGESLADLLDVTDETLAQMRALAQRLTAPQVLQCIRIFAQGDPSPRGVSLGQLSLEMAFVEAVLALKGQASASEPAARGMEARGPTTEVASEAEVYPKRAGRRPPTAAQRAQPAVPAGQQTSTPSVARQVSEPTRAQPASAEPTPSEARRTPGSGPGPAEPAQAGEVVGPEREGELAAPTRVEVAARWPEVVERFGAANKSIQALLRDVRPLEVEGDTVVLGCRFPFHRDRLNEGRTRAAVETMLSQVLGRRCRTRCVVDSGDAPREGSPADPFQTAMSDPVVKVAVSMGYRVKRIERDGETVYDAESQDDPAASGQAGQDAGGAR